MAKQSAPRLVEWIIILSNLVNWRYCHTIYSHLHVFIFPLHIWYDINFINYRAKL